jgi:hypothetical protein
LVSLDLFWAVSCNVPMQNILSMSVCRQSAWPGIIVAQQWEARFHCSNTLGNDRNRGHCWNTLLRNNVIRSRYCNNDTNYIVGQKWPRVTLVQQLPTWRGVKNTSGMSVYSKEYSFPILLLIEQLRDSLVLFPNYCSHFFIRFITTFISLLHSSSISSSLWCHSLSWDASEEMHFCLLYSFP